MTPAERDKRLLDAIRGRWNPVTAKVLEEGASPNARDSNGDTALELALRAGNAAIAARLLEAGAAIAGVKNPSPETEHICRSAQLLIAAKTGDAAGAARLLKAGADAGVQDVFDRSALSWASEAGNEDVAALLIGRGADANAGNESGLTPLMYAAGKGRTGVVAMLIDAGAAINAAATSQWYKGMTALMYAVANNHGETTALLVERGADRWMQERDGRTAEFFGQKHAGMSGILHATPEDLKLRREARQLERNIVLQREMPKMKPLQFRK